MDRFLKYPLGPEEPVPMQRMPDDPAGFVPIRAGPYDLCHGCWFYETKNETGARVACPRSRLGERCPCDPQRRPERRRAIFVPEDQLEYGNEED